MGVPWGELLVCLITFYDLDFNGDGEGKWMILLGFFMFVCLFVFLVFFFCFVLFCFGLGFVFFLHSPAISLGFTTFG